MPTAMDVARLPSIALALFLASSWACQGGAGEDAPEAAAEPGEAEWVEVEMEVGPGSFDFPETRSGLAELSSYKAVLAMTFDGTRAGRPEKWTSTYEMLYTREPAARQWTIRSSGTMAEGVSESLAFMAERDGAIYEIDDEGGCGAAALVPEDSLPQQWEPAGLLIGVFGAEAAGHETLDGLEVDHYTFDQRASLQPGTESTGEMWVASQGGYITRYTLTTRGGEGYFGEGVEGTLAWDYELTEVNQPVTIDLPEDCPSGMVDAPLPPDAANVLRGPGSLQYDTATGLAGVAAFYRERMPGLGWTLDRDHVDEAAALMSFTAGDETMMILASPAQARTRVRIVLSGPLE